MNPATGSGGGDHWVFGYGSLIFKVDFPFAERRPALIRGWARRFWQGSHDHRGTPAAPGRVLTLTPAPGRACVGIAYRVAHDVFEHLDHREKNGYRRIDTALSFLTGGGVPVATTYFAGADNEAFLGPAPEAEIAAHIARAAGPSGTNREYFEQLVAALRALSVTERHLEAIAAALPPETPAGRGAGKGTRV